MGKTGYVFDEGMLAHKDPQESNHPETPERLISIMERLESTGLLKHATKLEMNIEDIVDIPQVHSTFHHEKMLKTSQMDDEALAELARDFDSIYLCKDTAKSALVAVGSTVALAKAIATGKVSNGFAVVRPPGHHAEYDRPMGFCIYNNVAIAARALLSSNDGKTSADAIKRVMIIDWDVHHGNGTQNAFIDDPRVLFVSLHRYDNGRFYPHSVLADMYTVGEGKAAGKNVNIPWPNAGFGDAEYLHAFHRLILPIAYEFNPDFVFVSAGFDAAVGDPIGECLVTPEGFAHMTYLLKGLAGGKIMLALEGGYNIQAVADSSEACMRVLIGKEPPRLPRYLPPSESSLSVIEKVVKVLSPYWKCLMPRSLVAETEGPTVPLNDLVATYWSSVCTGKFELLNLPILDEKFSRYFTNRVHISDDILVKKRGIVIVAHETDPVLQKGDLIDSNLVNSTTSFYQPAFQDLIEKVLRRGFGVIDIYVPARTWKLRQTSAGSQEELLAYNDFFLHLWDTFLEVSSAKEIHIVSHGLPNYALVKLIESRPVEAKLKSIVLLSSTLFLPIVTPEKGPWYQAHSKVYVPGSDKPFGTAIPTANVYGKCFSAGKDGPLQRLNLPLQLQDQILDSICSKENK